MNPLVVHSGWDLLYLTCFGVGLVLSLLAFAGGFLHGTSAGMGTC